MERYDLIVLGGGVAGLGVAREAVSRGLRTLLLEAGKCCNATSDNTLRIIHGGFRYLQTMQIPRVFRSLADQSYVCRTYPDAVQSLPCMMPLARFGLKSRVPVTVAALTYGLAMRMKRSPLAVPQVISSAKFSEVFPALQNRGEHGALCWHDAVMTHPERIAGALIEEVKNHSGVVLEECVVQAVREEREGFIVATSSGEFSSTRVVNALGPWISSVELPLGLRGMRPLWCKGFNVVTRTQLHPTHAIGIEGGGRLFFCVPRGEGTSIGTWYVPVNELAVTEKPRVSEEELGQFLAAFNAALPEFQVTPDDIRGVDVGVLPMKRVGPRGPELYGSEIISATRGYTEIVSTKYTTFRSQGVRALDTIR